LGGSGVLGQTLISLLVYLVEIKKNTLENPFLKDLGYTILFGALSAMLGSVRIQIPGFEGYSDLREIPLLVSIFYIRNPLFITGLSLITLLGTVHPSVAVFLEHFVSLFFSWFAYHAIEKRKMPNVLLGISWMLTTVLYYGAFLIPLSIFARQLLGISTATKNFIDSYWSVLSSVKFEMVASAVVSSLYLMRFEVTQSLETANKNLEDTVRKRTQQLSEANEELKTLNQELLASNEEVAALNENLKTMVEERTKKINHQLTKLMEYSHMNSHEVRAPLARMLGLLSLLKIENNEEQRKELNDRLYAASQELDDVIKKMNRLLETDER
jgi:signal transduction histidine kinase